MPAEMCTFPNLQILKLESDLSVIQVCDRPLMFLLDTPGVLSPRIESVETGLKLALCGKITLLQVLMLFLSMEEQGSFKALTC